MKSAYHENEVKVRQYISGWHISSIINVWTKYGEPWVNGNEETDRITKTLRELNEVSIPWEWGQSQVIYFWLTCIDQIGCMVLEKLNPLRHWWKPDVNLTWPVVHENAVTVRWLMRGPNMVNLGCIGTQECFMFMSIYG